jgi:tetratricopeptide (TPR) repeat protein
MRAKLALAALALAALAVAVVLVVGRSRGTGGARAPDRPGRVTPVVGDGLRVVRIVAEPLHAVVGAEVRLSAVIERGDRRRGALRWRWVATRGRLAGDDRGEAVWTAPGKPGRFAVGVAVEDDQGRAQGEVVIEVRLPSPDEAAELSALMQQLADRSDAEAAELAALERRAGELRELGARRDSIEDRLRAQSAYEELADVLARLGRYEEARQVWDELLAGMLPTDAKYRGYRARAGDVAFFLGDEDAALAAWAAGGDYVQGMSRYYQAEVLERRGDRDAAMDAYQQAQDGSKWFGDPVYRHALLALEGGASPDEVARLLVEASPRLDRDRMLERLDGDPELAPLREALDATGRVDDLEAARPLQIESDLPD